MKTIKMVTQILLLSVLAFGAIGCSKDDDSKPSFRNRNYVDPRTGGNIYPGGDPFYSQNCPNCGYIFDNTYDMKPKLIDFLGLQQAPDEIGFTSGELYQSTGIVMRGQVDPSGRSGTLQIFIWDEIATYSNEAYQVSLRLEPSQSSGISGDRVRLVFSDSYGSVVLDGQFRQGLWEGRVSYQNNDGTGGSLGQFITGECSIIQC